MIYRKPRANEEGIYEKLSEHPLQSVAWGKFRETTGVVSERLIGFEVNEPVAQMQITFHPVPKLPYTIGYYPKGKWPDEVALQALRDLGKQQKALFIKLEPDVSAPPLKPTDVEGLRDFFEKQELVKGKPLFTPYSFILDLTKSEEELLGLMKSKTRYNIRVAQKHGVTITEDSTEQGFEAYLQLLKLTTKRQQFYAHTENYQRSMWQFMGKAGVARIFKAVYQGEVVVAWVVFVYRDRLFYPYGASSRKHRNVMASNLLMWEVIRYGKSLGLTSFDMWGSLGPNPNPKDPWYGFHTFKEGYGAPLAEFVGTYDLVLDYPKYKLYTLAEKWRWKWLKLRAALPI
jgi:lipid II:glycine glycyltransferase (peptidoglycan interpeptide bridge formation enzyme)